MCVCGCGCACMTWVLCSHWVGQSCPLVGSSSSPFQAAFFGSFFCKWNRLHPFLLCLLSCLSSVSLCPSFLALRGRPSLPSCLGGVSERERKKDQSYLIYFSFPYSHVLSLLYLSKPFSVYNIIFNSLHRACLPPHQVLFYKPRNGRLQSVGIIVYKLSHIYPFYNH